MNKGSKKTGKNYSSADSNKNEHVFGNSAKAPQPSEPKNDDVLRNNSHDKRDIHESAVSRNDSAVKAHRRGLHGQESWRTLLRMTDNWTSEYTSVQNMLNKLRRKSGSFGSVQTYCNILARFRRELKISPDQLVKLPREKVEKLVQSHCDMCHERSRRKGPSVKYANTVLQALKTFFECNGFNRENNSELRVSGYHQPPRTRNIPEYIPTLKESLIMAERAGSKRNRAIIYTLRSTGVRNSTLRAIIIGDILNELMEGQKNPLLKIEASWNNRIDGACKNCIPYNVFIGADATQAIAAMLKERQEVYGSYDVNEPLFISNHNQLNRSQRKTKPLSDRGLQIIVHETARAAEIQEWEAVHVHSMRKVFESVLRSPLADGTRMDIKDQEYFMGHVLPGSQDEYYDRSKVEEKRELYSKLVFEDKTGASLNTTHKFASLLGVNVYSLKREREAELGRELSCEEEEKYLEERIKSVFEGKNIEQRIISTTDLPSFIKDGWTYVPPPLPDGTVVVSRRRFSAG